MHTLLLLVLLLRCGEGPNQFLYKHVDVLLGMGATTTSFFKCSAAHTSDKRCQSYSVTMEWLRTHLTFALLRSVILCLRGSRVACSSPPPQIALCTLTIVRPNDDKPLRVSRDVIILFSGYWVRPTRHRLHPSF